MKYALIRSVYHTAAALHDTGHPLMQTGRLFVGRIEHPPAGAVPAKLDGSEGAVPQYLVLPTPMGPTGGNLPQGESAGYLGRSCDPFILAADPSRPDFQAQHLLPPGDVAAVCEERPLLRSAVERALCEWEANPGDQPRDACFRRAYAPAASREAREAFDFTKEPPALRERHGMHQFGQSCLLARPLIERGVRFVTVNRFETVFNEITWDIHGSHLFPPIQAVAESVGPWFEMGFSELLEDLHPRGMLDTTLLVAMGEFGRTPTLNPAGGRDHWPQGWTLLFAGGVRGGRVVGASDEMGAYPKDRPVTPADVVATLYHALGIRLDHEIPGPYGRPIRLVDPGVQPIRERF